MPGIPVVGSFKNPIPCQNFPASEIYGDEISKFVTLLVIITLRILVVNSPIIGYNSLLV